MHPAATTRLSYGSVSFRPSGAKARTTRPSRSRCCTSASTARALACFLTTLRKRRRDEATWQDPGGDLIQQRLEQVVIGPVHDRDVDVGAG